MRTIKIASALLLAILASCGPSDNAKYTLVVNKKEPVVQTQIVYQNDPALVAQIAELQAQIDELKAELVDLLARNADEHVVDNCSKDIDKKEEEKSELEKKLKH